MAALGLTGRAGGVPKGQNSPLETAKELVAWGRWKQARAVLQAASRDAGNQDNAALLAFWGHVEVEFGDLKTARALTQRAVQLDASCASCHLYRFEAMARHAQTLSQFRALLQLHRIKKQLQQAEALDPSLGDIQWGWIRFDLSVPAKLGGGSAEAMKHAARLSRLDPVDGHLARATIFKAEGKREEALSEYRAAAREHPEDADAMFALGKALYHAAEYQNAAAPLERAWAMNHASAFYSAYHAADLVRLGQAQKARAVLHTAQKEHPESRLGDFLTAQALVATKKDAGWARALLERYLGVPPEPEQATAEEARALLQQIGAGDRAQVTGDRLQVTGYRLQVTGGRPRGGRGRDRPRVVWPNLAAATAV